VHAALPEGAPLRTVGSDAVIKPAGHQFGIGLSARALGVGQAHQRGDGVGVTGQQPCRGAGFVFGVVLPQPATRTGQVTAGGLGSPGGVDVVVDRPPLELGDRQHLVHPLARTAAHRFRSPRLLWHLLCHNHSRTLCKCAVQKSRWVSVVEVALVQ
jgi:hypothetical protein